MPVLFTSGYAREAIIHNERLEEGVELLAKPFSYAALALKVRTAIDLKNRANAYPTRLTSAF